MTVRELKHEALAKQWASNIVQCRQSGLSVAAWCDAHQIQWMRETFTCAVKQETVWHTIKFCHANI